MEKLRQTGKDHAKMITRRQFMQIAGFVGLGLVTGCGPNQQQIEQIVQKAAADALVKIPTALPTGTPAPTQDIGATLEAVLAKRDAKTATAQASITPPAIPTPKQTETPKATATATPTETLATKEKFEWPNTPNDAAARWGGKNDKWVNHEYEVSNPSMNITTTNLIEWYYQGDLKDLKNPMPQTVAEAIKVFGEKFAMSDLRPIALEYSDSESWMTKIYKPLGIPEGRIIGWEILQRGKQLTVKLPTDYVIEGYTSMGTEKPQDDRCFTIISPEPPPAKNGLVTVYAYNFVKGVEGATIWGPGANPQKINAEQKTYGAGNPNNNPHYFNDGKPCLCDAIGFPSLGNQPATPTTTPTATATTTPTR